MLVYFLGKSSETEYVSWLPFTWLPFTRSPVDVSKPANASDGRSW
jgi:hypothetical protein